MTSRLPGVRTSSAGPRHGATAEQEGQSLPAWPLMAMLVGYPIWWLLGPGDMMWPVVAALMVVALGRRKNVQAPRGFGMWLLFLLWMACSSVQLDSASRLLGFGYRYALYLSATAVFIYVYNSTKSLSDRRICGVLTIFWLITIAGGYLGLLFPEASFRTPLGYVLPGGLQSNELVGEMVVRRFTQFESDSFFDRDPRPSAPFLYTNNWGNAYSLLMPFVVVYLTKIRRERRFWLVAAAVPLSFVPAFLTLNRGMFLGLAVAVAYVGLRALLAGNPRVLAGVALLAIVSVVGVAALPVQERLENRLETSSTTEDRASLYKESYERTLESPLFGFGAPRPSETAGAPSAGTQGQFWMILFSHGFVGIGLFMAWLLLLFLRSVKRADPLGLACNTVILVTMLEVFYYGILATGLILVMVAGAVALRPSPTTPRLPATEVRNDPARSTFRQ